MGNRLGLHTRLFCLASMVVLATIAPADASTVTYATGAPPGSLAAPHPDDGGVGVTQVDIGNPVGEIDRWELS